MKDIGVYIPDEWVDGLLGDSKIFELWLGYKEPTHPTSLSIFLVGGSSCETDHYEL